MTTGTFSASRFDGRTAEATPVVVRVEAGSVVVRALDGAVLDSAPLHRAVVSEPLDHAPRLLELPGRVTLEVPDPDHAFAHELAEAGERLSAAVRWQRRWPAVLAAVAAIVALLAGAYFKGLPIAARWAAFALPSGLEARMGTGTLAVLDSYYVSSSDLDSARRRRIADRFARAAATAAPGVGYRLEFRRVEQEINAFTLPGGIIVVLDGLVGFTDEDELLGVLGHELGHVVHKHAARMVLQSVGVGALASLLWGDFAGTAAHAPAVLGLLRYSRDYERDADDFAVVILRSQDLSARPLYTFLDRLRARPEQPRIDGIPDFLSAHPSTSERLERLEREMERSR